MDNQNERVQKDVKILYPMHGMELGIIKPDHEFYPDFAIWAELGSTITDDYNKAVRIAEFVEPVHADEVSETEKRGSGRPRTREI